MRSYPLFPSFNMTDYRPVPKTQEKLHADTSSTESHVIIDFQAGKDVGIGLFGRGSISTLSAGIRFAQFKASRKISGFQQTQGMHFQTSHFTTIITPGGGNFTQVREIWTSITANGSSSQKFDGLGPSIKWEASAPLWSDPRGGSVSLDWGINGALLFGKQAKKLRHQTASGYMCSAQGAYNRPQRACATYAQITSNVNVRTSRNVMVPNVGGFAGLSLRYQNIEAKFGYRADLFVKAFDGGTDARVSSNMLFHGPFASLSIGLGD